MERGREMEITCSMTRIRKLLICLVLRVEIKGRPHLQPNGKEKSKRPSGGKRSIVKPVFISLGLGRWTARGTHPLGHLSLPGFLRSQAESWRTPPRSPQLRDGWTTHGGHTDLIWQPSPLSVWTLDQQYLQPWELRESQNCQPQTDTC